LNISPFTLARPVIRALSLTAISVLLVSISLAWASRQQAGSPSFKSALNHSSPALFADKGGITPAAIITVNSLSDVANGSDGLCTLREAITAANNNAASGGVSGECAAGSGSGSDAITFSVTGTINLTGVLPDLSSDMTITGPGSSQLTVKRNTSDFYRIFNLVSGVVSMSGLTVTNGNPSGSANGGGIQNLATLGLTDVAVTSNQSGTGSGFGGGGVYNQGALTMTNSSVTGNSTPNGSAQISGGGITNVGTLTVTNCAVNNNQTGNSSSSNGGYGAGIFNTGAMTLTATTISNNLTGTSATNLGGLGGGIYNDSAGSVSLLNCTIADNNTGNGPGQKGYGGGIYTATAMTITGSTISGNTGNMSGVPLGGISNGATLTLVNSTISGNHGNGVTNANTGAGSRITNCTITLNEGSGVGGSFNATARNSIIAGNTGDDVVGTWVSNGHNLIGNKATSTGFVNGSNGDQVGTSGAPIDAHLGPLADNGGPPKTHALLSNSTALDAGDNCVTDAAHCGDANISQLANDQRGAGFSRIVDGPDADTTDTVDIGAFEAQVSVEDIPDKSTNEDTQLQFTFNLGGAANITSVTATSPNTTLLPDNVANIALSGSGSTRTLTINPVANLSGTSTITVTVNGNNSQSMTDTFQLTVNSVNDVPSFAKGPDQTVNEDASTQAISNWATSISVGPANESAQVPTFMVTGNTNPGLFSVAPAISGNGTLSYAPAANANGSATISLAIKDNGGTANGGVDTSIAQTFTITVNSVNDAPSFTRGPDQTVNEDAGAQTANNWATSIAAGPADEAGQGISFNITGNTNAALFSAGPAVSATGTLTYTPAANTNGSATITINLMDNGGTANGGVDTSASQTFVINVTAVNDPPSFTKGANQIVNEDSGAQTVVNWATAISPGPADESGQTVSFTVSNDNNALFLTQPAISPTGTLTYTPAANANGSTTVTISLKDNGGIANGGVDTSTLQTFSINVLSVNDAPSFTKGANQTANEDAGAQTVSNWATAISAGPAGESGQTLTFQITGNTNAALFSAGPAISSTGTLTYTPTANANGAATITINLQDSGGTANGGVDTSALQSFTITVNAVNDAPSFTKGADQTVNNAGAQTVAGWATNISAGTANESGQTLTFQVTGNTNSALFSAGPAVSSTGALTYTPASNAGGTATITINLKDNGGTANGGADTSASQSFTITVTPVGGFVSFAASSADTTENSGSTTVNVVRTGNTSLAATVNYATNGDAGVPCSTANGVASPKCDFTASLGTLNFAAGETSKPITILLSQDSFVEGPENITVTLSNPTGGAALGTTSSMSVTIADDATEPPGNIIDDANMFVRMHYHDFLNREGDQSGIDFWTGQMTNCGASDLLVCRVNVSGAFFLSIEFQQTGYLVERMYRTAYGQATGSSNLGGSHQVLVPVVRANEFLTDTQRIGRGVIVLQPGWETVLENNKQAYALEFVQTTRFITALPTSTTPTQFVDQLNQNAGMVLSPSERTAAINTFGIAADTTNVTARAQVLRQVAEDTDLYNAEFSRAFVLTEFIGYLRRNPNDAPELTLDYSGYEFWLNKLNENGGDYIKAEMVKAFISSDEYRKRFGP
jgi:CSLREA domain-containing protein